MCTKLCQHTASAGLEKTSKFNKIDTGRMVYIQVTVGVGFFLINLYKAKLPLVEPIMGIKKTDYCGSVKEMQVRGISFTTRISEITFATSVSCLAKERCLPSIAHFEINTRQQ